MIVNTHLKNKVLPMVTLMNENIFIRFWKGILVISVGFLIVKCVFLYPILKKPTLETKVEDIIISEKGISIKLQEKNKFKTYNVINEANIRIGEKIKFKKLDEAVYIINKRK